jgi:hypothetical protein
LILPVTRTLAPSGPSGANTLGVLEVIANSGKRKAAANLLR